MPSLAGAWRQKWLHDDCIATIPFGGSSRQGLFGDRRKQGIHFNLLHKDCGSRLKQQYLCVKEEIPVPREDMVKGYEFAKDQYVMFTPEELKALEEAGTHSADITEFVPLKTIDPVYFDKAYYLGPDKGGAKPYALLAGRCASRALRARRWAARGSSTS